MGTGANMHDFVRGYAQAVVGVGEDLAGGLIGTRLFSRDDAVDMPAQLRDVARDDLVVGIRDDAQAEARLFQHGQRAHDFGERGHGRDAVDQHLGVFRAVRKAQVLHAQAQRFSSDIGKVAVRRRAFQAMFMLVVNMQEL
ncbi:hypothetical protein D3C71_1560610 [compost metagenome]